MTMLELSPMASMLLNSLGLGPANVHDLMAIAENGTQRVEQCEQMLTEIHSMLESLTSRQSYVEATCAELLMIAREQRNPNLVAPQAPGYTEKLIDYAMIAGDSANG